MQTLLPFLNTIQEGRGRFDQSSPPNPAQKQTRMLSFPPKNCQHLKIEMCKCNQFSTGHATSELDPGEKTMPTVFYYFHTKPDTPNSSDFSASFVSCPRKLF